MSPYSPTGLSDSIQHVFDIHHALCSLGMFSRLIMTKKAIHSLILRESTHCLEYRFYQGKPGVRTELALSFCQKNCLA